MTVGEALAACGLDPREARLLLAAAGGLSEAAVLAFPERRLPADTLARFDEFAQRRARGEPAAYILGTKEFYGLELSVNPAVMVPRPETELLVDLALQRPFSSLADLGTGSGAIALAIKRARPAARVVAVEASAAALAVARQNAAKHNLAVEFRHGRWFEPLAGERFDVVLANPPYVAEGDPHLPALGFEPHVALTSGRDGLDAMREIVREAPGHLARGGWLMVEHGMGQDAAVRALMSQAGLEDVDSCPDLARIPRVAAGKVK
ncbi:MAG TPA: peptide chain release factor N(5)-glutamine methyltransferase [Burkholderiales bacterium]|nr:peptide chain release factor N(5)-glutamine methyltransferase [Burkholderiales bacterium]